MQHICKLCKKDFKTGPRLGGHIRYHLVPFSELKKDKTRRLRLIELRGHHCQKCKRTKWSGKAIPIELDHIDGNPNNNVESNLRLICPNCHAQTDTYKGKNAGRPPCPSRTQINSRKIQPT